MTSPFKSKLLNSFKDFTFASVFLSCSTIPACSLGFFSLTSSFDSLLISAPENTNDHLDDSAANAIHCIFMSDLDKRRPN